MFPNAGVGVGVGVRVGVGAVVGGRQVRRGVRRLTLGCCLLAVSVRSVLLVAIAWRQAASAAEGGGVGWLLPGRLSGNALWGGFFPWR